MSLMGNRITVTKKTTTRSEENNDEEETEEDEEEEEEEEIEEDEEVELNISPTTTWTQDCDLKKVTWIKTRRWITYMQWAGPRWNEKNGLDHHEEIPHQTLPHEENQWIPKESQCKTASRQWVSSCLLYTSPSPRD